MEYLAHISDDKTRKQTVLEHSQNVAMLAKQAEEKQFRHWLLHYNMLVFIKRDELFTLFRTLVS